MFAVRRTLNCKGRLLSLERPIVMGILNTSPDSFYDGGRYQSLDAALRQTEQMLSEGAAIIDVGGMSSRPGAAQISIQEELRRVLPVIEAIAGRFPEAFISIDTVHAQTAREAVAAGACIVNDISAGRLTEGMYETVAELGVPYVLMHMQGRPETMQQQAQYDDVVQEVLDFLIAEVGRLQAAGVKDILLDPGFGFGKTMEHNFQLLQNLHVLGILPYPVLAGISRKSMIYRSLGISPKEALNGTTALHIVALQQGALLLRVHDVAEAVQVVRLWEQLQSAQYSPA
ncbi:MAG TPA: dihydropteroate synthase [Saprospiraceae bacterium]|nr:dihydropteroate synthase [Saprospiraceae bacterium]HRK83473.1 dihydropteroate synthase [Saprospiraceae bacterium]